MVFFLNVDVEMSVICPTNKHTNAVENTIEFNDVGVTDNFFIHRLRYSFYTILIEKFTTIAYFNFE